MNGSVPAVSVLVTVYNREQYLADSLRSILASTLPDFEVLVIDDLSSDRSLEIAYKLRSEDDRLQVFANEKNLGDYGNRMKAASLARGKYLKYVDSDDLIYRHSLEIMVESMEQYPDAAVGLVHSLPEDESPYPWCLKPQEAYQKHFLGRGCLSCGPTGAIIRRDAFEAAGGFRKEWGVLSDTDLWFRLAAKWPVVLLPPGLIWWRRHEHQEYTKEGAAVDYVQRGYQLDMLHLNDASCPLGEAEQQKACRKRRHRVARRVLSLALRERKLGLARKIYADAALSWKELLIGLRGASPAVIATTLSAPQVLS